MNNFSNGLLEPDMMKRLTKYWLRSEVGLMYIAVSEEAEEARACILDWASKEKRVLWGCTLVKDHVFALKAWEDKENLDTALRGAAEGLLQSLAPVLGTDQGKSAQVAIGAAELPRHGSGILLTEGAVFHAFKEAAIHAERNRSGRFKVELTNQEIAATKQLEDEQVCSIESLATKLPQIEPQVRVSDVAAIFEENQNIHNLIVEKDSVPLGLIKRERLYQLLARQYGTALYWNRPISILMDSSPLIVEGSLSVESVSQQAMAREFSQLYDVVIITREGKYIGGASIRSILECITNLRTQEALSANPLTNLPGGIESAAKWSGELNAALRSRLSMRIWIISNGLTIVTATAKAMK